MAVDSFRARVTAAGRPAVVSLVLGSVVLLLSLAALAAVVAEPHDDVEVTSTRGALQADGYRVRGTDGPGLRPGDVVVAVGERSYDEVVRHPLRGGVPAVDGEDVSYHVVRDGRSLTVAVPLEQRSFREVVGTDWSGAVLVPVLALMGALLLWRRPDLPAARTLFVVGGLAVLSWVLTTHGPTPLDLAAGRWWYLGGGLALLAVEVALVHFVIVLPDGPGAPARRWLPLVYVVPLGVHLIDAAVTSAGAPPARTLGAWAYPRLEPLVVAVTVAAAIVGYRRATDDLARRQLRLIAAQLLVAGALFIALFALPEALGSDPLLPSDLAAAPFWSFPPVLAIAVLRFDLFELRVLLHRSLLYSSLTAVLAALYVALAGTAAALLGHGAGLGASAAIAAGVALAVQPLRARLRRLADRLVYGTSAGPSEALAALGRRLEDRGHPDALLTAVVDTVAGSLGRDHVAIEAGIDGGAEVVASRGEPGPARAEVPLLHQGTAVGRIVVGLRRPGDQLGVGEARLLDGLAAHVATAVIAVRRGDDLQRSRERLVTAVEEERRRLGRDLHDGLGPRLAASSMKLEFAERVAAKDPARAAELHGEVRTELGDVIAEVRRIVYALRPAALDQLGLIGALRELANRLAGPSGPGARSMEVQVEVDGDAGQLPAAVEVAAYRIASEAVTNAVRHSGGSRCRIEIRVDDQLAVSVVDDGIGLPDRPRPGVGLPSMAERAQELGGTLSVSPAPGGGTMVVARLPRGPR